MREPNPDGPAPLSVLLEEFYRDITWRSYFKHLVKQLGSKRSWAVLTVYSHILQPS